MRFSFDYLVDAAFKGRLKGDLEATRFVDLPFATKLKVILSIKALRGLRAHLIGLFSEYTALVRRLEATGTTTDFIKFVIEHENEKDVKKQRARLNSWPTTRDLPESSIKITDEWNNGENAGGGDRVIVSVKYEGIDTDEIIAAYIEKMHFSESVAQALVVKRAARPDVSKLKRLERFGKG